MTYIAVSCLALLGLATVVFAETVRRLIREHARERQLLTNQILHLSGRTWQPPPAADIAEQPEPEPDDRYDLINPDA